jgi:hypothetical protein
VQGEHGHLGVFAVLPGQHAVLAVEDLVVGAVPVLRDLQADRPATLTVTAFCFNGLSGTRKHFARQYTLADIQPHPFRAGSLQLAAPRIKASPGETAPTTSAA